MRFYSSSSSYGLNAYVYSVSMSSCAPYVNIYDGSSSTSSLLRTVSCTNTSSGTYYSTGRYLYVYYYRGYTTGQDFIIKIQRGSSLSSGSLNTYYLDNYLSHCSSQVTVDSSSTYYLDPAYSSNSYVSAPSSCYMRFYSSSSSYGLSAYVYSVSMSSCTPYVSIYDGSSSSSSLLVRDKM
ncbi:uncharacterized protein LOC106164749 [Lingula anatina]|uniref:Uncharacterized protein LOC106164749 n=1 Tax=Lingula anatina TaxID=7574 RepID=A0A1S3IIZ5_LINAN|nr:uncharacterized protein LOC106164749 [Lingula anatina]|eukprot:XP_013398215.1 uncharacterized protein LOC106164749 [Lingula anatina]